MTFGYKEDGGEWQIIFTNDGYYGIGSARIGGLRIMPYSDLENRHRLLSISKAASFIQKHHPLAFAAAKAIRNEASRAQALKVLLIKAVEETSA